MSQSLFFFAKNPYDLFLDLKTLDLRDQPQNLIFWDKIL